MDSAITTALTSSRKWMRLTSYSRNIWISIVWKISSKILLTSLQAKLSNAADNAALAEIYSLAADAATFASMAKELDADRGAALQTKVDEVNADIYEKAKTIVTSYMNAYENAVNSIKNLADLQTSSVKRADAVAYLDKLTDTDKTELYKKLEDTDKVYSEKNSVAGWEGSLKALRSVRTAKPFRTALWRAAA